MAKKASARASALRQAAMSQTEQPQTGQPQTASKPAGENNNPKQSDAASLLNHDHHDVEQLFQQYKSTQNHDEKRKLARQICTEFIVHGKLEEKELYPAVGKQGADKQGNAERQGGAEKQGAEPGKSAFDSTVDSDKEYETMQRNDHGRPRGSPGGSRNDPAYGDDQGSYGRQSGQRQDEFGRSFGNDERDGGQYGGQHAQARPDVERYGQDLQRNDRYSQQRGGGQGGQQGGYFGQGDSQYESRDSDRYSRRGGDQYGNQRGYGGGQQYGGPREHQRGPNGDYDQGGQYGGQEGRMFYEREGRETRGYESEGNEGYYGRPGSDRNSRNGDVERYAPGYGGDPVYSGRRSRDYPYGDDNLIRSERGRHGSYGSGRGGNDGGGYDNRDRNASSESSLRGVQDGDEHWPRDARDQYVSRKGYQQR